MSTSLKVELICKILLVICMMRISCSMEVVHPFLSASSLIIIILPHPIKLLYMKPTGVKLHVLTVVFLLS